MTSFWSFYLVTLAITIVLTLCVKFCFTMNGDEFFWSHVILVDLISAIPYMGILITAVLIMLVFIGILTGDLEPKFEQ